MASPISDAATDMTETSAAGPTFSVGGGVSPSGASSRRLHGRALRSRSVRSISTRDHAFRCLPRIAGSSAIGHPSRQSACPKATSSM